MLRSEKGTWTIAQHVIRLGYHVRVIGVNWQALTDREYSDDGDLYVNGRLYEVKWREEEWSCAGDYKYGTVFVNRAERIRDTGPPVAGWYILSSSRRHAIYVSSRARPRFRIVQSRHNHYEGLLSYAEIGKYDRDVHFFRVLGE